MPTAHPAIAATHRSVPGKPASFNVWSAAELCNWSWVARHNKSSMSWTEQTSNTDCFAESSAFSTPGARFISLSSAPIAFTHVRKDASISKPAASIALISAKSSTAVRICGCVKKAFRRAASSPAVIRPMHRNTVTSSRFWIIKLSIISPFGVLTSFYPIRDIDVFGSVSFNQVVVIRPAGFIYS